MTPIEKMCEAWWGADLGGETRSWQHVTETVRENHIKRMSAALRALAECDPTEAMGTKMIAAFAAGKEAGDLLDASRVYILAAAEEWDPSPASIKEERGDD